MFTALILVCIGNIKSADTCYYHAHEAFFPTYRECKANIKDSVLNYPFLFEHYDESIGDTWKVTDWQCVNWNSVKV